MAQEPVNDSLVLEKSEPQAVMPQSNGGWLKRGGNKTPGAGRPSNQVRQACRERFEELVPRLAAVAAGTLTRTALNKDGEAVKIAPSWKEQISAIDTLGKYGLGTKIEGEIDATVTFEFVLRREA